jgi:hypothetical protein
MRKSLEQEEQEWLGITAADVSCTRLQPLVLNQSDFLPTLSALSDHDL